MRNLYALTLLALILALIPGASAVQADEESIDKAVAAAKAWLELVDRSKYDESWAASAALFRQAVTQEQWRQKISAARAPLGKRIFRKLVLTKYETTLPQAPEGEYVVIQFKTIFENESHTLETVTPMKDPDGEWRVSGYFIR